MKHWWRILALGCMVVVTTAFFAACGSKATASPVGDTSADQTNDSATPNTPPDETDTGHTSGATEPSNPADNDDTNEEPTPHTHQYGDWCIINATCTTPGYEERTCTCGDRQTRNTTAALGHNYLETVETPATCTTAGLSVRRCQICYDSTTTTIVPLGHTYDSTTHRCERCQADDPDYTAPVPTPSFQKLAGSYWYIVDGDYAIYFDSDDHFSTCKYTLTEDGTFQKGKAKNYQGSYFTSSYTNSVTGEVTQTIHFTDESDIEGIESYFVLTFTMETDATTGATMYILTGTTFLDFTSNKNRILIFAGYDL